MTFKQAVLIFLALIVTLFPCIFIDHGSFSCVIVILIMGACFYGGISAGIIKDYKDPPSRQHLFSINMLHCKKCNQLIPREDFCPKCGEKNMEVCKKCEEKEPINLVKKDICEIDIFKADEIQRGYVNRGRSLKYIVFLSYLYFWLKLPSYLVSKVGPDIMDNIHPFGILIAPLLFVCMEHRYSQSQIKRRKEFPIKFPDLEKIIKKGGK
jgi:hypothetical protein